MLNRRPNASEAIENTLLRTAWPHFFGNLRRVIKLDSLQNLITFKNWILLTFRTFGNNDVQFPKSSEWLHRPLPGVQQRSDPAVCAKVQHCQSAGQPPEVRELGVGSTANRPTLFGK